MPWPLFPGLFVFEDRPPIPGRPFEMKEKRHAAHELVDDLLAREAADPPVAVIRGAPTDLWANGTSGVTFVESSSCPVE
jgi:hypothetical protein